MPNRVVEILNEGDPPSLAREPLDRVELAARAHWKRFAPKLCSQLEQCSPTALDQAIRNANHFMEWQIGLHLARHPQLHRFQVEELYREGLWILPERTDADDDDPASEDSSNDGPDAVFDQMLRRAEPKFRKARTQNNK